MRAVFYQETLGLCWDPDAKSKEDNELFNISESDHLLTSYARLKAGVGIAAALPCFIFHPVPWVLCGANPSAKNDTDRETSVGLPLFPKGPQWMILSQELDHLREPVFLEGTGPPTAVVAALARRRTALKNGPLLMLLYSML